MSSPSFSMWVTTLVELTKLKTIEFGWASVFRPTVGRLFNKIGGLLSTFLVSTFLVSDLSSFEDCCCVVVVVVVVAAVVVNTCFSLTSRMFDSAAFSWVGRAAAALLVKTGTIWAAGAVSTVTFLSDIFSEIFSKLFSSNLVEEATGNSDLSVSTISFNFFSFSSFLIGDNEIGFSSSLFRLITTFFSSFRFSFETTTEAEADVVDEEVTNWLVDDPTNGW